ncbi:conserved Plasmodium protein, unknown function, partial [Plasmodium malariae]
KNKKKKKQKRYILTKNNHKDINTYHIISKNKKTNLNEKDVKYIFVNNHKLFQNNNYDIRCVHQNKCTNPSFQVTHSKKRDFGLIREVSREYLTRKNFKNIFYSKSNVVRYFPEDGKFLIVDGGNKNSSTRSCSNCSHNLYKYELASTPIHESKNTQNSFNRDYRRIIKATNKRKIFHILLLDSFHKNTNKRDKTCIQSNKKYSKIFKNSQNLQKKMIYVPPQKKRKISINNNEKVSKNLKTINKDKLIKHKYTNKSDKDSKNEMYVQNKTIKTLTHKSKKCNKKYNNKIKNMIIQNNLNKIILHSNKCQESKFDNPNINYISHDQKNYIKKTLYQKNFMINDTVLNDEDANNDYSHTPANDNVFKNEITPNKMEFDNDNINSKRNGNSNSSSSSSSNSNSNSNSS